MKNKILIFSTAYYPMVGGAEIAVKEITDRLPEIEFDMITARMNRNFFAFEKVGNVCVYRVGFGIPLLDKLLLPFLGGIKAYRLEAEKKYSAFWGIMITFGSGAAYVCNLWRSLTGKKQVKMILTLQEGDSEVHLQYRWFGLISLSWRLALLRTHFLTALSTFLIKRAERYGYRGPLMLVPNGVDLATFSHIFTEGEKKEYIQKLQKKEDEILLVTVSRLVKKNAVDDCIRALAYLPENISLVILGKGKEGTKLSMLTKKLGLKDRVKFIGFVSHNEIPKYFSVCDIFVRPSRSEGFGNSFIEAMAAHLPVVATPVGGIPDFIDDRETGVFCSPDHPKSIADAVTLLTEDIALSHRIIQNAYKRVSERYGWEHVAHLMEKVFI